MRQVREMVIPILFSFLAAKTWHFGQCSKQNGQKFQKMSIPVGFDHITLYKL